MRLWHYKLILYLPNSQLVAQWRELNSIYKNSPHHILIEYVYHYDKEYLWHYSVAVKNEMINRGFKIKSYSNFNSYFDNIIHGETILHYPEHNNRYLIQCFRNLQEKYDRGQKDFTKEQYCKLYSFVVDKLKAGLIYTDSDDKDLCHSPIRTNKYSAKVRCFDIEYDEYDKEELGEKDLPKEVEVSFTYSEGDDFNEFVTEELTNTTGCLVNSYRSTIMEVQNLRMIK